MPYLGDMLIFRIFISCWTRTVSNRSISGLWPLALEQVNMALGVNVNFVMCCTGTVEAVCYSVRACVWSYR